MPDLGRWMVTFVDQHGDDNDYNDSDDVMGWLSASLYGDVLTVTYENDEDKVIERYRVVPL